MSSNHTLFQAFLLWYPEFCISLVGFTILAWVHEMVHLFLQNIFSYLLLFCLLVRTSKYRKQALSYIHHTHTHYCLVSKFIPNSFTFASALNVIQNCSSKYVIFNRLPSYQLCHRCSPTSCLVTTHYQTVVQFTLSIRAVNLVPSAHSVL